MAKSQKRSRKRCDGKKQSFDTREAASAALNGMLRNKAKRGKVVVGVLRVYGCSCGRFHYGSTKDIIWGLVNKL